MRRRKRGENIPSFLLLTYHPIFLFLCASLPEGRKKKRKNDLLTSASAESEKKTFLGSSSKMRRLIKRSRRIMSGIRSLFNGSFVVSGRMSSH
ncbi:hypothetical protein CEXT_805221 [Caerostris extrusa]|uniref:Secreted protein n=1 Tax=Caerostris extrusa TaxID=172846 RepID=A0AAV4XZ78_CAEEX|nr:hypothetical protein CEXT_805221 [Caerostris extrusa]